MKNNHAQDNLTGTSIRQEWYLRFARWLFSLDPLYPKKQHSTDPAERMYHSLRRSLRTTAKCRYNASIRLHRIGSFSFLTTTLLSLGLIFIPMIQLAEIPLAYPERVLDSLQVFFAVAVLVYSVINSTAHYETRAKSLNECGDKIKELNRKLDTEIFRARNQGTTLDLQPVNEIYSRISTASENHSRADYGLAILQATESFHVTGIPRLWLNIKVLYGNYEAYLFPAILIIAEIIIILDTLSVTHVLTGIFNSLK